MTPTLQGATRLLELVSAVQSVPEGGRRRTAACSSMEVPMCSVAVALTAFRRPATKDRKKLGRSSAESIIPPRPARPRASDCN